MKKVISLIAAICMVISLLPMSVFAAGTEHTHSWSSSWTASGTHHWHDCTADGCTISSEAECSGYGAHDFSQYPYRCTVCNYSSAHEHYGGTATCEYNATCEGCGTVYGETNPNNHQFPDGFGKKIDSSSHKIMCSCGYVFVASEPHNFTPWDKNSDGTEERWCEDCLYAETRGAQHTHSYSKATCIAPAICSCGGTTGEKDPTNHTGGTEIRNAVAAAHGQEGYTGDTYCKGCGAKIASGESIPKLEDIPVKIDADADVESVTFEPNENVAIPDGASLVVKKQEVDLSSILWLTSPDTTVTEIDSDFSVMSGGIFTDSDGTEYRSGELVLIDGQKYYIDKYSGSGSVLPVIRLSDGQICEYDMENRLFKSRSDSFVQFLPAKSETVHIGGVYYDVQTSYTDASGELIKVLTLQDQPAGMMTGSKVELFDDFSPNNILTKDSNYLGKIVYGNKNDYIDLMEGSSYYVYSLAASDIKLLSESGDPLFTNATAQTEYVGTVKQKISIDLPNTENDANYFSVHFHDVDFVYQNIRLNDIGEITVSPDRGWVESLHFVYDFSPFVVYAFVEAQEPEIKVITSNTLDTPDVGGADDSDVAAESNDLTWLWITIAVVVVSGAVVAFAVTKRKKTN